MATVNLISALRLLRQFGDSPEVVNVIQATLDELDRLYKIEAYAAEMLRAGRGEIDPLVIEAASRLIKAQQHYPK